MIVLTTHTVEGKRVTKYFGLVSGEAILGATSSRICLRVSGTSWAAALQRTSGNFAKRKTLLFRR